MSRESRRELEARAVDEVRGWQTDQDMFDDAAAMYAGMNRTDMRVADIVQRQGPITAGKLGVEARLTSGAITAVVDRLEAAGFVRRVRDTEDRRRVMVEFNHEILAKAEPVFGPVAREGMESLKRYSDQELATILRFVRESREFLQRHTTRVHALIAERQEAAAAGSRAAAPVSKAAAGSRAPKAS